MSGILLGIYQNMRSFGKGGWVVHSSGAGPIGLHPRNQIFATATNLYIGAKFSNVSSTPYAVCSVATTANPTLNWAVFYERTTAAGGGGSSASAMYASGTSLYSLVSENSDAAYITQYAQSNGSLTYQNKFSGPSSGVQAVDIVEDSSANLLLSFSFKPTNGREASITKVDSAFAVQWGFKLQNETLYGKSTYGDSDFGQLFLDASNNIYAGGNLSGSGGSQTAICGLCKYNSAGTTLWQRTYGNTSAGNTQVNFQGAWLNSAGNPMVAFGGDAGDGLYFAEVSASTGTYTGSFKQKLTFAGNVSSYKESIVETDPSGNVWVLMNNSNTSIVLAKINAALNTVTAITITSSVIIYIRSFFVNATGVYFGVINSGNTASNYFKVLTDIAPFIGSVVTTNLATFTFSAATATLASHAFTAGSALTNTKTVAMNTYTTAVLVSDPQANTFTPYTF